MSFIRENLLKIMIILGVIIIVIILISSCSMKSSGPVVEEYTAMEQDMVTAAQNLVTKQSRFLPKELGDTNSIKLSTLQDNELIGSLSSKEDTNVSCSGYVLIEKKSKNTYKYFPYLKCGKYYETSSISDYILKNEKLVTEDDGLYQFGQNYVFKGENPNNYIYIGGKLFRIISINNKNELEVISTEPYDDTISWDDRYNSQYEDNVGINNFEKSRLKDFLVDIYNNNEEFFTKKIKSYIVPHDFCVGKRTQKDNSDLSGSVECSQVSKNMKVGMIYANEYLNASVDPNCKTILSNECENYNYFLNISKYMYTLTASGDDTSKIYYVKRGVLSTTDASDEVEIYPVIYIDSNTIYQSGNGTKEKPYSVK